MAPRESSGWNLAPSRGDRRVFSAGGLLDGAAWAGNPCNRHSDSWPPSPEIEWPIPLAAPFLPSLQRISMFAKEKVRRRCLNPTNGVTAVIRADHTPRPNNNRIRSAYRRTCRCFHGTQRACAVDLGGGNNSYGRGSCDLNRSRCSGWRNGRRWRAAEGFRSRTRRT